MTRRAFHLKQVLTLASASLWQALFAQNGMQAKPEVWALEGKALAAALVALMDELAQAQAAVVAHVLVQIQRVHALSVRSGIDALHNVSAPASPLHAAFAALACDQERALWALVHQPEVFGLAELVLGADQRMGKRGWQRLMIPQAEQVFTGSADMAALERTLSELFSKRRQAPRVCEIDAFERHLDGGLQLRILIEDDTQRNLEFGEDDRTHWRSVRPPVAIDLIYLRSSGITDVIAPGGTRVRDQVVSAFGKHVLRQMVTARQVSVPRYLLNRLKQGLVLPGSPAELARLHPLALSIAKVRLLSAKLRAITAPAMDVTFKAPPDASVPDVLEGIASRQLTAPFLGSGFDVIDAVVSVFFIGDGLGKTHKPLHIELKPTGIANLREMEEPDQHLALSLLQLWGVMLSDQAASEAHDRNAPSALTSTEVSA